MDDWTEKYRPHSLRDLIGNDSQLSQLSRWATQWQQGIPKKRAVILSGKPGIGKTSTAHALAHDLGWTVIELNASDARNEAILKRIAGAGAVNETFDDSGTYKSSREGYHKLIILDEADNLTERSQEPTTVAGVDYGDKGAKKAISMMAKTTQQPLVLIVNDLYALTRGGGDQLKTLCELIEFKPLTVFQVIELLKRICRAEGITTDDRTLSVLAARSKGDVRSAVNDLQAVSLNRMSLDLKALDALGYRDRETIVFDAVRDVFKARSGKASRESLRSADIDPETFLLWITENIPREYLDPRDLAKGFDAAAEADVFLGRVRRRNSYDLWSYACDLMSAGVSSAKTHQYGNFSYKYPSWIRLMAGSQPPRALRDAVAVKIARLVHASKRKAREELFGVFQQLFREDLSFARHMTVTLALSEAEVEFLLGKAHEDRVKLILNPDEPSASVKRVSVKEKKEAGDAGQQPSLLDF